MTEAALFFIAYALICQCTPLSFFGKLIMMFFLIMGFVSFGWAIL